MKISIVGRGNVANHIYKAALSSPNIEVEKVVTRDDTPLIWENVVQISSKDLSLSSSQLFVLAVSDDSISEVLNQYKFPKKATIIHCAGSVSIDIFNSRIENYGVFYPFQSFSKERKIDFKNVPCFIESNNENSDELISKFARSLSEKVNLLDSENRQNLHIAAVFANNFSNHMFKIADDLISKSDLPSNILHDLIDETVDKYKAIGAKNAQTGPAIRSDYSTMSQHESKLKSPEIRELYMILSKHIMKGND